MQGARCRDAEWSATRDADRERAGRAARLDAVAVACLCEVDQYVIRIRRLAHDVLRARRGRSGSVVRWEQNDLISAAAQMHSEHAAREHVAVRARQPCLTGVVPATTTLSHACWAEVFGAWASRRATPPGSATVFGETCFGKSTSMLPLGELTSNRTWVVSEVLARTGAAACGTRATGRRPLASRSFDRRARTFLAGGTRRRG